MKKTILLLTAVVLIFPALVEAQNKLQVNQGEYRIKPDSAQWTNTDITVSAEAEKYAEFFAEAIAKKGEMVEVKRFNEKFIKMTGAINGLFETEFKGIIYDDNFIEVVEGREDKNKVVIFIIFGLVSIFLMILSNLFFSKNAAAAAAVAAVAAVVAVVAAFAAAAADDIRAYKISSTIFYIFMAMFFIVIYI